MARIESITPVAESGLSDSLSSEIFDQISAFAGYGFNKSHAAAYAAISFRTAWLKRHHPEAFFAAAMNLELGGVEEIATFAGELRARRLTLWRPSINGSRAVFTPLKLEEPRNGYRFGIAYALTAIRGVGRDAAEAIVAERNARGDFTAIADFLGRMDGRVGRTALQALARAGAFDCLKTDRGTALGAVRGARAKADTRQMSMFDLDIIEAEPEIAAVELDRDARLDNEFDVLGHFMSEHPLETLAPDIAARGLRFSDSVMKAGHKRLRKATMAAVVCGVDVRRTRSGEVMAVLALSDPEGSFEAVAFAESWGRIRAAVKKKARLAVQVAVTDRGGERRLLVEDVRTLAPAPGETGTVAA